MAKLTFEGLDEIEITDHTSKHKYHNKQQRTVDGPTDTKAQEQLPPESKCLTFSKRICSNFV